MKTTMMLMAVICCGLMGLATPPIVSNIRAIQREGTKLVDIYYDLSDSDGDLSNVRVRLSDNDGLDYYVPAETLTGDVGTNITAGVDRHVVWNAGIDWDGEYSDKMRVKIGAVDGRGCPGMLFGSEVLPGGFLMGYDETSKEGNGPSRHVCIPWSFWLGAYEVTVGQYCEYLNWAASLGYVKHENYSSVVATEKMPFQDIVAKGSLMCSIGSGQQIRWRVNSFEVMEGMTNRPAVVTWYGAMAFARFYGCDLPTEAEWEKGVRGARHDALGNHLLYPWGDTYAGDYANFSRRFQVSTLTDVGSYSNAYEAVNGLYDVCGNVGEWTRSKRIDITYYPTTESLTNEVNAVSFGARVCRGLGSLILDRVEDTPSSLRYYSATYANYILLGFRVCRRVGVDESDPECGEQSGSAEFLTTGIETFEGWPARGSNQFGYISSNGFSWGLGFAWACVETSQWAASGTKCIYQYNGGSGSGSGAFSEFRLPVTSGPVVEVRLKAGNFDASSRRIRLYSSVTGNSYSNVSKEIPGASGYTSISLKPSIEGVYNYITVDFGGLYIDDVEVIYRGTN